MSLVFGSCNSLLRVVLREAFMDFHEELKEHFARQAKTSYCPANFRANDHFALHESSPQWERIRLDEMPQLLPPP
jgi:hypothetical protein